MERQLIATGNKTISLKITAAKNKIEAAIKNIIDVALSVSSGRALLPSSLAEERYSKRRWLVRNRRDKASSGENPIGVLVNN